MNKFSKNPDLSKLTKNGPWQKQELIVIMKEIFTIKLKKEKNIYPNSVNYTLAIK